MCAVQCYKLYAPVNYLHSANILDLFRQILLGDIDIGKYRDNWNEYLQTSNGNEKGNILYVVFLQFRNMLVVGGGRGAGKKFSSGLDLHVL